MKASIGISKQRDRENQHIQLIKHVLFYIPCKICKRSLISIDFIESVYELFDNSSYILGGCTRGYGLRCLYVNIMYGNRALILHGLSWNGLVNSI